VFYPIKNLPASPKDVEINGKSLRFVKCTFNSGYYNNGYAIIDKSISNFDHKVVKIEGRCLKTKWNTGIILYFFVDFCISRWDS
jgi:hypothetical protein